jgi:hypothetical protein
MKVPYTQEFKIFEKKKGFFLTIDSIQFIGLIVLLIFIYLMEHFEFLIPKSIMIIMGTILILTVIINLLRTEEVVGIWTGKITLTLNTITVKNRTYPIEEIDKIEFKNIDDFEGSLINISSSFSAKKSKGVNNEIAIKTTNGDKLRINFLQTKENRLVNNEGLLIHYYTKGIINWTRLCSILNITGYQKIQEFKHKINL